MTSIERGRTWNDVGERSGASLVGALIDFRSLVFGKVIGEGGNGKVMEGMLGSRHVAIKTIDERFMEEVHFLRFHKNDFILEYVGLCQHESKTYLVTELMKNGSVWSYLAVHNASPLTRVRFVMCAARALVHLHAHNVLHGDLKPTNLLVCDDERHTKLGDFGLAVALGERTTVTGVRFTPGYMAPEVLEGVYGLPADIFALGVTLNTVLSGLEQPLPWQGGHYQVHDLGRLLKDWPVQVWRGLRPELDALVRQCIDPSPLARPSALQVVNALQTIVWRMELEERGPPFDPSLVSPLFSGMMDAGVTDGADFEEGAEEDDNGGRGEEEEEGEEISEIGNNEDDESGFDGDEEAEAGLSDLTHSTSPPPGYSLFAGLMQPMPCPTTYPMPVPLISQPMDPSSYAYAPGWDINGVSQVVSPSIEDTMVAGEGMNPGPGPSDLTEFLPGAEYYYCNWGLSWEPPPTNPIAIDVAESVLDWNEDPSFSFPMALTPTAGLTSLPFAAFGSGTPQAYQHAYYHHSQPPSEVSQYQHQSQSLSHDEAAYYEEETMSYNPYESKPYMYEPTPPPHPQQFCVSFLPAAVLSGSPPLCFFGSDIATQVAESVLETEEAASLSRGARELPAYPQQMLVV